ncbi:MULTISPECIES: ribosome biogenesis factor YjgA [unclassified Marinobacterium]|jgi:ribosome-associated protein|uniref:ribosome biogenesis factor YjgA n=1 Tax=unclassified Marinobacterium TaxID=2644139 RepID=UPI00156A5D92|nr:MULTISPECIES: ribosome biogenesis factor YjgA [unclassified Marinobacterium]NRP35451.1 hypothetical protein [Marinobacterium sp. xm-d-579]NRP46252.1 hypothetical protein [Marinobacterium sp. xm-d-543]NRP58648.1 hypothetical protein [Marinobacterium sp. xm-d-564]NRQ22588.1 hypothetical protein [Marinobacterium sp. xm-m-312]
MSSKNFSKESDQEIELVSRSQVKREAEELQKLGGRITELRLDQQAKVPMSERLAEACAEMTRITSNGAKKRQLQYIGKLMRTEDADAIRVAIDQFDSASAAHNQKFHALEQLRERLIAGDKSALSEVMEKFENCDMQHLRALIRNAQKERKENKPPANFRKVFQYLRDLDDES